MRLLWDGEPMPKGVQANLVKTRSENIGRITIRGGRSLAALFEGVESGLFEAQEDDGTPIARATITIESVNLYVVSESPDDDAAAEVYGVAIGAMPNGGLYA